MRLSLSKEQNPEEVQSPVLAILDRLWQIKSQSIALITYWHAQSNESDVRSGLMVQLEDERRHLRLIGEEIRRLGGRISTERREGTVGRAFGLIRAQSTDLKRLCAYYRGVKLATHSRTSQLVQVVEPITATLMGQISRDEERHIRWADIRISHQMKPADVRDCNVLMDKMDATIEGSWQKLWLDLIRSRMRHIS